jgi:hypothetical protein
MCTYDCLYTICDLESREDIGNLMLIQSVIAEDCLEFFPMMLIKVGTWLEKSGRKSMIVEIPDERANPRDYLLKNGWKKQYT